MKRRIARPSSVSGATATARTAVGDCHQRRRTRVTQAETSIQQTSRSASPP